MLRGFFSNPPANRLDLPLVHQPLEESPGGQNHSPEFKFPPIHQAQPDHPVSGIRSGVPVKNQLANLTFIQGHPRLMRHRLTGHKTVVLPVTLGTRALHRRAFGTVQHAEVDHGLIGKVGHRAAQRIHLPCDLPLGDSTDRGVAGHLSNAVFVK